MGVRCKQLAILAKPGIERYLAGPEGIEPPIAVLETAVMPFNYGPMAIFYATRCVEATFV